MPELTKYEAKLLKRYVTRFKERFTTNVARVIEEHFRGARPPAIQETIEQLTILLRQLEVETNPVQIHDAHGSLIRRVVIEERRESAQEIEGPLRRATDARLAHHLTNELRLLQEMMEAPWFAASHTAPVPQLTDFMSIRYAEAVGVGVELDEREFDEKFNILEAPRLFLPDLAYYRKRCRLRDNPLAVAFADIDDFKRFNTAHGEARVDRDLLTPFMECLEAHFFARGHCYRFGGDEYLMLIPNCGETWAVSLLRDLQERLANCNYRGIDGRPTISIGVVIVDGDTFLTDREVLEAANRGKAYAKATAKGSIATFDGELYRDAELRLSVKPVPSVDSP